MHPHECQENALAIIRIRRACTPSSGSQWRQPPSEAAVQSPRSGAGRRRKLVYRDALPLRVRQEDRTAVDQRGGTSMGSGVGPERSTILDAIRVAT